MQYLIIIVLVILVLVLILNITIAFMLVKIYDLSNEIFHSTEKMNKNISELSEPLFKLNQKLRELFDNGI